MYLLLPSLNVAFWKLLPYGTQMGFQRRVHLATVATPLAQHRENGKVAWDTNYWFFFWILLPSVVSILLPHWFSEDKFLIRPSFPIPWYPQSWCLFSKFLPRSMHTKDRFSVKRSCKFLWSLDGSRVEIGWYSTIAPKGLLALWMVLHTVFHWDFPICQEVFADNNSIPWNQPTIFIQAWLEQYRRRPFFYSAYGSFSNTVCLGSMRSVDVRWLQDRSSQDLPNSNELSEEITFGLCDRSRNFRKLFSASCEVFALHGKEWIHWMAIYCTTTAYRWLSLDSHPSLRALWSAVIKSPNFSARGRASPVRLLQEALVTLVLKHTSPFRSFVKWE